MSEIQRCNECSVALFRNYSRPTRKRGNQKYCANCSLEVRKTQKANYQRRQQKKKLGERV